MTGTSGGAQRNIVAGSENIQLLATGGTDNTAAVALDLNLNSAGRELGTLTFDAATVFNSTGNRAATLTVYFSTDGSSWTELTGTNLPYVATNNVVGSAVVSAILPPALDNQPTVKLRFYDYNGVGGTTGSRPKVSIDNVVVTSTPSGVVDTTPPVKVSVNPADDTAGVLTTSNLTVTYDESIKAGTGDIVIRLSDGDPGTLVDTIPVTNTSRVQFSGSTVTINPSVVLSNSTGYYVEFVSGVFTDIAGNAAPALAGFGSWNFTTRAAPSVLISQYYDGTGNSKFLELRNLTASPLPLSGYRLVAWSPSDPDGNQSWKTGTGSSPRVTNFTNGETIPANGHFLLSDAVAVDPPYAVSNNDLPQSFPSGMAFGGTAGTASTASVVLYSAATNETANVVDAISIVTTEGIDISYHRKNDSVLPGFDFTIGTSITAYPDVWETKTLAEVASAVPADLWYLKASQDIQTLTLTLTDNSVSEGDGAVALTGTVTRTGPTTSALTVTVTGTDPSEATAPGTVEIPIGESTSLPFDIAAVNDLYLDGTKTVTFTVSAPFFISNSKNVSFTDEPGDPAFPIVINEVDTDTPGTDNAEFVELYNNSGIEQSLDGMVLVLFNGTGDVSYGTIDLTGFEIPANGYFVVGSDNVVPDADLPVWTTNALQNGPDGVALYIGAASSFPNGTLATTTVGTLVDALVYGTTADDGLIAALTSDYTFVNEAGGGSVETKSISRVPDGGSSFDISDYVTKAITPGVSNTAPYFSDWVLANAPNQTAKQDHDNDGVSNGVEYFFGAAGSTFTANPQPNASGLISFPHPTSTPGTTYSVKTSPDLVTWTPVTTTEAGGFINYTLPPGQGKLFVRLEVVTAP